MKRQLFENAIQDFRMAVRRWRRRPLLTAGIVVTLGFGLGTSTAILIAFRAAVLEPPPFDEPEELVHAWEVRSGASQREPTSWATFSDWRSRSSQLADVQGYNPGNFTTGAGDDARMLRGAEVTAGFFGMLGVRPAAGRDFGGTDGAPEADVAIISERLARSLGGDALGRTLSVNGTRRVVIGVLPASFEFALLQDADVWLPLGVDEEERADRGERWIHAVARLREGADIEGARAELVAVTADIARAHAATMAGRTAALLPLDDALLGSVKPILTNLLLAAALLLITLGTNLALLMLAQHAERAPELAVAAALGATRGRLIRQLITESLALAAAGAVAGVLVAGAAVRALLTVIPENIRIDMPYLDGAGLNGAAVIAIIGAAVALALAFGLLPALLTTRTRAVSGGGRTTSDRRERSLRRGLVVTQLALTMVLLVSTALLATSFRNVAADDSGFGDPATIVGARVSLSGTLYQEPAAQQRFYESLLDASGAMPGVTHVGAVSQLPGGGGGMTTLQPVGALLDDAPRATLRIVGGDYFATMRIDLLDGRLFNAGDDADATPVILISSQLAHSIDERGAVLGRRIMLDDTGDTEWLVVGIVADAEVAAADAGAVPAVYLPHLQIAENRMSLVLRTGLPPAAVEQQLRALVRRMDPGVPVYAVSTLSRQLHESRAVFSRWFPMILSIVFATAALALALVALYAVSAHDIAARRREFAIRIALGASPKNVRRLLWTQTLSLAALGIMIGGLGARAASGLLASLLYGVGMGEWRVYVMVAGAVAGLAMLTVLQPAIRAGRVEPGACIRES